jgi:hypothetical protein
LVQSCNGPTRVDECDTKVAVSRKPGIIGSSER